MVNLLNFEILSFVRNSIVLRYYYRHFVETNLKVDGNSQRFIVPGLRQINHPTRLLWKARCLKTMLHSPFKLGRLVSFTWLRFQSFRISSIFFSPPTSSFISSFFHNQAVLMRTYHRPDLFHYSWC